MIHLTVAAPLGIDSVFFSFIQRLAVQNGHACVDPPDQQLDEAEPGGWIEAMRHSSLHHFVMGYRYPPSYWKTLAKSASTVCLLADPDGIVRQVKRIQKNEERLDEGGNLFSSVQAIRHALESTIELAEWILAEHRSTLRILPPAAAFILHPQAAFRRLEQFYLQADVSFSTSCWEGFSEEAIPYFNQLMPINKNIKAEIIKQLTLDECTPARIEAVLALFPD